MLKILVCFLGFFSLLLGEVIDHLKIPLKKSGNHKMKGIDFIYMINLDQRPEKYQFSKDQFSIYGIEPYRFSAVNGWELSLEELNDVGLKFSPEMQGGIMGTCYHLGGNFEPSHEIIQRYGQNYFCHCMARGTIGIVLSHLSVLQDAWENGYETIWVMEDDVDVLRDPRIISVLIEELDALVGEENWDILFTDQDIRDKNGYHKQFSGNAKRPDFIKQASDNNYFLRKAINPKFSQIGARYGAHSMIIRKSGIKKLLRFFNAHQIFLPYDMEYFLPTGIRLFCVNEDIVSNLLNAPSDNGGPNYLTPK